MRDTNGDVDADVGAGGDEDGWMASSSCFVRVEDSEKRGVGANWEEEEEAAVGRWMVRSEEGGGRGLVRKRCGEGVWVDWGVSVERV